MEIKLDLHTHTSFSPHAYSTLTENVNAAVERGMEAIAMTNHGPDSDDFSHMWHFANLVHIPRIINGIVVFTGVEASFVDLNGNLDVDDAVLKKMDIVIASRHRNEFGMDETNCRAMLCKAMDNPYVDIMGHIGRNLFEISEEDCDIIAKTAKEKGKLIELNENCIRGKRIEFYENNTKRLIIACKRNNTPIVVNSDAHYCSHIGDYRGSVEFLEEINFDENLIMNTNLEKFMNYISKKKNIDMTKGE